MTCAHLDQLDAYLDGDLAPRAARAYEAHAEACAACTEELALAQRLQGALRALPAEPCPYNVYRGALDRIARERQDRPAAASAATLGRVRLPRWQAVGLGVALVVLAALALLFYRPAAETLPGPRVAETPVDEAPLPETPAPAQRPLVLEDAPDAATPDPGPSDAGRPTPSAPQAAPPREVADAAPSRPDPDMPQDEAEAQAAREGVLLAFSLFADANRQATRSVRENVGHGLDYVTDALTFLR